MINRHSVRSINGILLMWLAGAIAGSLPGQTAGTELTNIQDVLALPDIGAAPGTRAVRLHGVVVDVSAKGDEFSLHDGEDCISVALESGTPAPNLASEVEVEGRVFSEPFLERKRARIEATRLTILGAGTLPQPKAAGIEDASKFNHLDQWVSVEGTVLQVRSSMSLFTIQLVGEGASCNVLVRDWPRESIPRDWIGGRVRVTGINKAFLPGSTFLSVVIPSAAQVTLLKTGVTDPLDAPVTTVRALREGGGRAERVKLTATLLGATVGNVYYARTGDGDAFSFYMLHPIDEDKSGRFSTPIVIPQCKPGDVLEVVGIPGSIDPGVHLNFGVARVVKDGAEPSPITTDIATISGGKYVHNLVEVHGRLVSMDDVLVAPGRWRTTMKLDDSGHPIIAFLDAPSRGALAHLEQDHQLHVHGIVTGAPHFPEIRLWVRNPEDVQSLGIATDVVTRWLWAGLGAASIIVVVLASWALILGRSRKEIRNLNASLEERVAERTAELASAKDEIARALSHERELSELKTRFVSLVSHEFRTPLGVTMSAVEVLRHYGSRITEEKRAELHDDIFSATVQMSGLMEQVLLLGRAEAGKILCHPAPLDLIGHCNRLVDDALAATHQRCPINLIIEGDFTGAMMDGTLVRHILSNLLSNAVKYSPDGSPVDFKLGREGDEVVLTVQDYGIGIPEADQARLFEAFHRASNVGEVPGTGLGLLLVRRCVDLHHGTISLQSEEGVGTVFTVRLPLHRK